MSDRPSRGLQPFDGRVTQRPGTPVRRTSPAKAPSGRDASSPPPVSLAPARKVRPLVWELPPASHEISLRSVRRVVELDPIGRFADYDILGRLALGGMAEILLARHRGTSPVGRPVVVKKILAHFAEEKEFVEMFEDEARIGLALRHPNIVRFHDSGVFNGQRYIEMEWIDGQPLGRLLRRARDHGGVPVPIAVSIVAQIADALEHAHSLREPTGERMRLIHRDVSPHNVIIGFDGEVKLLDFGIARADTQEHRTRAGVVKGKFAYMAPEQCRGTSIDHRVDIFALGVVLYETLTGYALYRRDTEVATMQAVVSAPVPTLAERVLAPPPELERIVQMALAKSPDDRYQTAGALRDDLLRFLKSQQWTVSREDIARLMRVCFPDELGRGPRVDSTPFGSSRVVADGPEMRRLQAAPRMPSGTRELDDLDADQPLPEVPAAANIDLDLVPIGEMVEASPPPRYEPVALVTDPESGAPGRELTSHPRQTSMERPLQASVERLPTAPTPRWMLTLVAAVLAIAGVGLALWHPWEEAAPASSSVTPATATGPATRATLLVASVPPGAQVSLGDRVVGPAPIEVRDIEPGTYTVRAELPGYAPWEQQVELTAGGGELLTARLEEAVDLDWTETPGRLTIETVPQGVTVSIGDHVLGTTPLRRVPVPLGTYPMRLEDPYGEVHRVRVVVDGDEALSIDLADLRR